MQTAQQAFDALVFDHCRDTTGYGVAFTTTAGALERAALCDCQLVRNGRYLLAGAAMVPAGRVVAFVDAGGAMVWSDAHPELSGDDSGSDDAGEHRATPAAGVTPEQRLMVLRFATRPLRGDGPAFPTPAVSSAASDASSDAVPSTAEGTSRTLVIVARAVPTRLFRRVRVRCYRRNWYLHRRRHRRPQCHRKLHHCVAEARMRHRRKRTNWRDEPRPGEADAWATAKAARRGGAAARDEREDRWQQRWQRVVGAE
jgi:hypothetical protein